MILGNQIEWALHCMTVMAGLPDSVQVSAKALAEFHGVPKEYLSKSLQLLSQAGLVHSTPGAKGGYSLSRAPQKISFLDIVEAIEGKKKTFNCQEIRKNNPCLGKQEKKFSSVCEIAAVMYEADESWRHVLRKKTLSDITSALSKKITKEQSSAMQDWFIP
jgi:Rrf2 family protein